MPALVILTAYSVKKAGLMKEEHAGALINYVVYFALPALTLKEVSNIHIDITALGTVAIAWGSILSSLLIGYSVGSLLKLEDKTLKSFVLVSSFGNTAFLGYPFAFSLFGAEGLKYAVLYDQLGSFIAVITLGFTIATGKPSFRTVATFPPLIALLVGLLLRGTTMPEPVNTTLETAGMSLIPTVLFALGLKLSVRDIMDSVKLSSLALIIKMVVVPISLSILLNQLSLSDLPYRVALLETAMPPMVMSGVLAIQYGLDTKLAVSSITLGIILSFITVPLLLR